MKRFFAFLLCLTLLCLMLPAILAAGVFSEYAADAGANTYTFRVNLKETESGSLSVYSESGSLKNDAQSGMRFRGASVQSTEFSNWEEAGNAAVEGTDYSVDTNGDYTVMTALGLAKIANLVNSGEEQFAGKTVTLSQSIDLLDGGVAGYAKDTVTAENSWNPIGTLSYDFAANQVTVMPFLGVFDGNDCTVKNLFINYPDVFAKNAGLFGSTLSDFNIGGQCVIQNIRIEGAKIEAGFPIANSFLVGMAADTVLSGCTVDETSEMTVLSDDVQLNGGIAGGAQESTLDLGGETLIEDCVNNGTITGGMVTGGIVGGTGQKILNCTNNGTITASMNVGGIAGLYSEDNGFAPFEIINCANAGNITATYSWAGGIVGEIYVESEDGLIANCSNSGNITAGGDAGGISGSSAGMQIKNCYNTGDIQGDGSAENLGGIAGFQSETGSLVNCYSAGNVSGGVAESTGAAVGQNKGTVKNMYYPQGAAALGAVSSGTAENVIAFDTSKKLESALPTGEATLWSALNAWVLAQADEQYRTWANTDAPEFGVLEYAAELTVGEETTGFLSFAEAWKAGADSGQPFAVKMLADVKSSEYKGKITDYSGTIRVSGVYATLDLNGFTLLYDLEDQYGVFSVSSAGNLTIEDTSAEKTGKITSSFEYANRDAGDQEPGNGLIGILGRDSQLILNGGEISGIQTAEGKIYSAVNVTAGRFIMNGGKISDNACTGVVVRNGGIFTMNGGEISGNTSNGMGGGILSRWGVVEINDGAKIIGNIALYPYWGKAGNGAGGGIAEITNGSSGDLNAASSGITLSGVVDISKNKGPDGQDDDISVVGLQCTSLDKMDPVQYKSYAVSVGESFRAENPIAIRVLNSGSANGANIVHASGKNLLDDFYSADPRFIIGIHADNTLHLAKESKGNSIRAKVQLDRKVSLSYDEATYTEIPYGRVDKLIIEVADYTPEYTIVYKDDENNIVNEFPAELGKYSVNISYLYYNTDSGRVYTSERTFYFEIVKAEPEYTAPANLTATYGDTLSGVALPDGWTWKDDTQSVGNAGSNKFKAEFTPADTDHYHTAEADVTVAVNPRPIRVAWSGAEKLVYDGTEKAVMAAVENALPDDTVNLTLTGTVRATAKGVYTAEVAAVDNPNYTLTGGENLSMEWSVAPAMPVIAEPPAAARLTRGKKLSASEIEDGVVKGIGDTVLEGAFAWKDGTETMRESGKFTRTVVFTPADENYTTAEIDITVSVYRSTSGDTVRYTVIFETNGGSRISSFSVERNGTVSEPDVPVKAGYSFGGWFTDEACTAEYDFSAKVTKDVILYAKWTEDKKPADPEAWKNPYTDVHEDDWFYDAVRAMDEQGIFVGAAEGAFAPNEKITRAMMVTVLWRIENRPVVNYLMTFEDVKPDAYYAEAVRWAAGNRIVKGYSDTEFAPDKLISREEIAAIMQRYAEYRKMDTTAKADLTAFADAHLVSEWARENVEWAVGSGVISGRDDNRIDPSESATRAETAAVLQRFLKMNSDG